MADEEGHIDFLETQLDLIGRIGIERYTAEPYRRPRRRRHAGPARREVVGAGRQAQKTAGSVWPSPPFTFLRFTSVALF